MAWKYSTGVNPVSTTLSSGPSAGGTTFNITASTGLPTVASPDFGTARIQAEGANTAEDIIYTRSSLAITLANSTTLASAHASGATIDFDVQSSAAMDQIKRDAAAMVPTVAISTDVTATIGARNRVTAATARAITIPDGTSDSDEILIKVTLASVALCTITGKLTAASSKSRIMWAGESLLLGWSTVLGGWEVLECYIRPMTCVLSLAADQTGIAQNTVVKILFNTTVIDNTGLMADLTNRFAIIKRAGNYDVSVIGKMDAPTAANILVAVGILSGNGTVSNSSINGSQVEGGYGGGTASRKITCAAADNIGGFVYTMAADNRNIKSPDPALSVSEIPDFAVT